MDNDKLEVFDGMNGELVHRMLNMFETVAKKDSNLILQSSQAVEHVKSMIKDTVTGKVKKTDQELLVDIEQYVDE
jgi:hypothetical protein